MSDCNDHLTLRPELQAISQALQWLENIAERENWPRRTTFGLTLCLDEALTNIVSYAFDSPMAEPTITVACHLEADRVMIELRDNGRAHDPTVHEPPELAANLDEAQFGGHGVRLMRHYLHDVAYQRIAGWNCLTMIMRHV